MVTQHKGHEITSVAWQRPVKFMPQVSILSFAGSFATDQWRFLHAEFDTQEEAEQYGINFCKDVIDGFAH